MTQTLLSINNLYKSHAAPNHNSAWWNLHKTSYINAINGLDISIKRGETLCVVGESGCGKSTLARLVMGLEKPDAGSISYQGKIISGLSDKARMPYRRRMQMVFQDPYTALNPRHTVLHALVEPVLYHQPKLHRQHAIDQAMAQLLAVGIEPALAQRFPHQLSGGQRQRINIARALMVEPEFIVADEPLSALDVSIQAQILNLLAQLQSQQQLTYLIFSHNLAAVEHMADRVAVMYDGQVCEIASREQLFSQPQHPYTKALLAASPQIYTPPNKHHRLVGDVPNRIPLRHVQHGCSLQDRCPQAFETCRHQTPQLTPLTTQHAVACHHTQPPVSQGNSHDPEH
ncbi:MAG: ABC transporter ATP-binding protein [Oceanospirillaceae bacterium]|jgi:peptide/nickel transport system ATP-binding protein|nr:ABC transporter ATP-binding protein [Oceanospirillaceae bacterium]